MHVQYKIQDIAYRGLEDWPRTRQLLSESCLCSSGRLSVCRLCVSRSLSLALPLSQCKAASRHPYPERQSLLTGTVLQSLVAGAILQSLVTETVVSYRDSLSVVSYRDSLSVVSY